MKNQFHKNSCSWTSNQPEWEDETNSGLYGSTPRLRRQNLNCFNISQNSLIEKIERHTCKKKWWKGVGGWVEKVERIRLEMRLTTILDYPSHTSSRIFAEATYALLVTTLCLVHALSASYTSYIHRWINPFCYLHLIQQSNICNKCDILVVL